MIFFFKPKKIVVDLFTTLPGAYHYAKPMLAKKFFPHWWKQLPNEYKVDQYLHHSSTMKRCYGMVELYQHGFVVPLWADLLIEIAPIGSDTYRWQAADNLKIEVHPQEQRGSYLPSTHYQHIKIDNPWQARSKEKISFLMLQPTWNYLSPQDVIVPPGMVPIHSLGVLNINMFLPKADHPKTLFLNLGQPLVQLVGLDARPIELATHLVDEKEMNKSVKPRPAMFTHVASKIKKAEKCPLHTGA